MRTSRPLAALLVGAAVLSACSSDGDAGDRDEITVDDASEATGDETPAPVDVDLADLSIDLEGIDVAATFGDQEVTGERLRELVLAELPAALVDVTDEERAGVEEQVIRGLLTQEIQIALVRAYAADEYGIEVSQEDVDDQFAQTIEEAGGEDGFAAFLAQQGLSEEQARDRIEVEALVVALQDAVTEDVDVDDEAVRALYDARDAEGAWEQSEVRHILLDTEEEALDALARVQDGEDFSDVAVDVSTGPSGPNGGELGAAPRGAYVPEFEMAVWSEDTEIGVALEPVETQFGFHVIIVDARIDQSFEDVEDQLRAELGATAESAAFDEAVQAALDAVEVEVDPAIGVWDAELRQVVAAAP